MKPKVMIAMPTRSGPDEYAENAVEAASIQYGAPVIRPRIEPRDKARNVIAHRFVSDPKEFDYLLFVDDDTPIPVDAIEQLVSVDQPIVSAVQPLYLSRRVVANIAPLPKAGDGVPRWPAWWSWERPSKPFQISLCGFGCVLIHRLVFEALEWPWFAERIVDREGLDHRTEDVFFCLKCHDAGIPIWCNPNVMCGHRKRIDLAKWVPRDSVSVIPQGEAVEAKTG